MTLSLRHFLQRQTQRDQQRGEANTAAPAEDIVMRAPNRRTGRTDSGLGNRAAGESGGGAVDCERLGWSEEERM